LNFILTLEPYDIITIMANEFMNPYGTQTAIPFLFGEDSASQEAQRAYNEAAEKVGEFILGSGEPMTVDGQPVATGEPFFGLLGPTGVTKIGGLPKLSRFAPKKAKTQDAPMLPVLRQGQAPAVTGGRPPAVIPTGTVIPMGTTPAAPTSNLLRQLASGAVVGTALGGTIGAALSGDKEDAPTVTQPQLATVPGLEGGFGGMDLSQFLEPVRAEREAARSAFEQASRDREARLAQEEAGRRMQEARSRGELGTKEERLTRLATESQGILSQLEPTQLTYLLGELGYDISPKGAKPTTPTTSTEPVVAEVQEFDTYEEADAAGLPIGTRVKVGGRDAIIT
jgi:hypothetical protein